MNIGELARAADTKIETIRYYERIGLLPVPRRTTGNYRTYSAADVRRLTFTRRARNLGFSIEQVRTLLDLAEHLSSETVGNLGEIEDRAWLAEIDGGELGPATSPIGRS